MRAEPTQAKTNQTLLRLGDMVNEVDDKYFSKYLSFDTQMTYQDTLAAATTTIEKIVDGGVKAAGSGELVRRSRVFTL